MEGKEEQRLDFTQLLPIEIILIIFSYLPDKKALLSLLLVSHTWKTLVKQSSLSKLLGREINYSRHFFKSLGQVIKESEISSSSSQSHVRNTSLSPSQRLLAIATTEKLELLNAKTGETWASVPIKCDWKLCKQGNEIPLETGKIITNRLSIQFSPHENYLVAIPLYSKSKITERNYYPVYGPILPQETDLSNVTGGIRIWYINKKEKKLQEVDVEKKFSLQSEYGKIILWENEQTFLYREERSYKEKIYNIELRTLSEKENAFCYPGYLAHNEKYQVCQNREDGNYILRIYDLKNSSIYKTIDLGIFSALKVIFSPTNSEQFVYIDCDTNEEATKHRIQFIDLKKEKFSEEIILENPIIKNPVFFENGNYLLIHSNEFFPPIDEVVIWDVQNNKQLRYINVSFSPSSMFTIGNDQVLLLDEFTHIWLLTFSKEGKNDLAYEEKSKESKDFLKKWSPVSTLRTQGFLPEPSGSRENIKDEEDEEEQEYSSSSDLEI